MATIIYFLCALTSLACVGLLFNAYRHSGHRLLFWSTLCFAGLTINNLLVVLDRVMFPEVDLIMFRLSSTLIALLLLLFGLIWHED